MIRDKKKSKLIRQSLIIGLWVVLCGAFWIDYIVAYRVNFFILYLVPILLISHKEGIRHGLVMSIAGAAFWLLADFASGQPYEYFLIPCWNAFTRFVLFVSAAYMIHLWKVSSHLARFDSLTGLSNRRSFRESLDAEIKRSNRYLRPFSIAFIDLDNLKHANDLRGHKSGDEMIRRLSETIRGVVRDADVAARLGGDEFAIIFSETGQAGAELAIERIQNRLKDSKKNSAGEFLTISAGISIFLNGVASVDAAIQSADRLMYQAKKAGKNCIKARIFSDSSISSAGGSIS